MARFDRSKLDWAGKAWLRMIRRMRGHGRPTFARNTRANVAITFALAVLPIMGFMGAGIDYGHAISVKESLQSGVDSTALMLSKTAATANSTQLQSSATTFFNGVFNRSDSGGASVTATYTSSGGNQVVVNGTAQVPTYFLGVAGFQTLTVNATSTAKWGSSRLRVALVLDNTGSMGSSGKLAALQTATLNLLTQLKGVVVTPGDVYVSIVPFVKDVNLGSANYNQSWIDWTDWDANNGSCSRRNGSTKATCSGTWTPDSHSTWNGCVMDRGGANGPDAANYDTNVSAPVVGTSASLFAAEQYSSCPQAVKGLSYDWTTMNSVVNAMAANGNTNQAIGLAQGWMSLTGGGPYTVPAMDPKYTYKQIIIILTDGLNTQDRWYSNQSQIDARQTLTCTNIKNSGVILYTVEVSTDGTPKSSLLQTCASDSTKFFYLTKASDIITTFSQIGTNISQLYLSN